MRRASRLVLHFVPLAVLAGCLDPRDGEVRAGDPPGSVVSPEPPEPPEPGSLVGAPLIALALPAPGTACAGPALSGGLGVDASPDATGDACLEELFAGPCVEDRTLWAHDDAGRPVHAWYELVDLESHKARYIYGPPVLRRSTRWVYDSHGDVVRETRSDTPDAVPFIATDTTYDAQRRVVARVVRWSDEGRGLFDADHAEYTTWGPHGAVARREVWSDGVLYDGEQTTFDAAGRATEVHRLDVEGEWLMKEQVYGASGLLLEVWDYERAGLLAITSFEHDAAGTLRRSVRARQDSLRWVDVTEFDAAGRETRYTQDEDDDGQVDFIRETDFDAAGHVVRTYTGYEMDASGSPQRWVEAVSTLDDAGRPVRVVQRAITYDHSRTPRYQLNVNETSHRYSADGLEVASERVSGAGIPLAASVTRYLTAAREVDQKVWEQLDSDGDGAFDIRWDWTWRADGQLAQVAEYGGVDGVDGVADRLDRFGRLERLERWWFDAAGRAVTHAQDFDGDGVADRHSESRFECGDLVVE